MPTPFSIPRDRCAVLTDPVLHDEILAHVGSDDATASILRSLERFGMDGTIRAYEVTPQPSRRTHRQVEGWSWTVHAVR